MVKISESETQLNLGKRIRWFRRKLDLSQEKLSEKSDISATYLGHIEQGIKAPSLSVLIRLANSLQIEIWKLFKF